MTHYRIYQLDRSDHITAGHSIECGSDTDALRTAGRLLAQHRATAVEVWQGAGRIGRLRAGGPWVRLRSRLTARFAPPLNRRATS